MTRPSPETVSDRDRRLILLTAVLANILGNMGLIGINVGLPEIERELGLSAALMGWIPLSLFMAMAAIAAPGAKLADIWGRRRTTLIALALCLISLTVSALAWNPASLLVCRVFTGLGLAVVFTNLTAMAASVHPPQLRGRILGYTIAAVYVGLSLGPAICGYLVVWFSWRAIFWVSALGFLPPLIFCLMVKAEQRPAQGEKLDWRGALLWAATVAALFFGLTNITQMPLGPILVALGFLSARAYIHLSLLSVNPVLDIRLFKSNRRFAFSSLAAFISYSASMGTGFILSLYLQYTKGLTPAQAGLVLMIQPACQALITPFTGRLSDRVDAGNMASAGMTILGLTLGFLAFNLSPATSLSIFMTILVILGIGFATFSAPNSNAIIGSVPPDQVGQASGTITATRLYGQVFSIALTTLVFSLIIGPGRITPDRYPAFMEAATVCLALFTPICLLGVLASLTRGRLKDAP